jgi:hypothetical protein
MALPSSELEYWNGSAWVKEDNVITLAITDRLHEPLMLEAQIGNFSNAALNTREAIYTDFLKVRVREKFSYKYIFYGKISRARPDRDNTWGHVVNIVALDNLRELSNTRLDEDITGQTTRSGLISTMITNHVWTQGGVPNVGVLDGTKFLTSTSSEASSILDKTFKGDRKSILDIMQEVSKEDPNSFFFGYDFYLDAEFNGNTPTPDLFYFPRGNIPYGTLPASGLTLKFNSLESNQVLPIMGDYSFPKIASELVTRTQVRWVDSNDKPRKTDTILINHGATSGGNFDIDDIVTWSGGGSAKVYLVGTNNRWISIGPDSVDVDDVEANSNWLNNISGLTISSSTSGSVSATANSTSASPPGSLRETIEQDAEVVAQAYDASSAKAANVRGASILYSSGDSVIRGSLKVLKYPQYVITGTHTGSNDAVTLTDSSKTFTNLGIFKSDIIQNTTDGSRATITLVGGTTLTGNLSGGTDNNWDNGDTYEISVPIRAGHRVYVEDIPSGSNVSNQDCLVTSISYTEGAGIHIADIRLLVHSGGRGSTVPLISKQAVKGVEAATSVPSNDQRGIKARSSLNWTTSIILSPDGTNGHNTVDWSSGSIYFFDGSNFAISAGTTGAISAVTYIYFAKSSPTVLQTTTSASTAQGSDNIVIATCENVASGGTVTIETTTGVAQKNYYSMDSLFDGAAYGRIAMGNLLSNNLNLGSGSLAGSLSLSKTTDSSGRSTVTDNEKTGASRGYSGFDNNSFLSKDHFLNDIGLAFQSHSGTTWAGINANGVIGINSGTLTFQIQATNGVAGFGGNMGTEASPNYKCTLHSGGIDLGTATSGGNSGQGFLNFKAELASYGTYKITNFNGILQLFGGSELKLRPGGSDGTWSFGDSALSWGSIWGHNIKVYRSTGSFSTLTSNSSGDLLWNGSAISGGGSGDIEGVNITAGTHLSGDQNTSSGTHTQTINHINANGSYHIPINGASGELLVYSSAGQATWQSPSSHGTHGGSGDVNQNAFSVVAVSSSGGSSSGSSIYADTTTDTFTLVAGSGITLTGGGTADTITIASSGGGGGSGTVNSGSSGYLAYYPSTGTTVDDQSALQLVSGVVKFHASDDHNNQRLVQLYAGTNSLCSVSFYGEADTGLYNYGGTDAPALAAGGSTKLICNITSSGTPTTHIYQALNVHGSLTKTSGTFSIPHPLDEENKHLVHGFVESPRFDLIYRGTVTLSNGTATASIDEASNNMTVGTFTALTKNPQVWVQNDTGWGSVKGVVENGNIIISAEDATSSDTISWLIVAERNDTYVNSSKEPWTDENGVFVPEWNNSDLSFWEDEAPTPPEGRPEGEDGLEWEGE